MLVKIWHYDVIMTSYVGFAGFAGFAGVQTADIGAYIASKCITLLEQL